LSPKASYIEDERLEEEEDNECVLEERRHNKELEKIDSLYLEIQQDMANI
jgi:hypothetical protein